MKWMQQTPAARWIERTGTSGRAVEDALTDLLARHRLGIHMIEEPACRIQVARKTLETMDHPRCRDIARALSESYPRLFSLSLPPSPAAERSMVPYDVQEGLPNNYGYLMDLSQDQPNPPRTVRVSHRNLSSMEEHDCKNFALEELSYRGSRHGPFMAEMEQYYRALGNFHEQLGINTREKMDYYDQMERWRDGILAAMRGPDAGKHSDAQLDMLGQYYERCPDRFAELKGAYNDGIIDAHNEILTACHTQHIKAVVVPSYYGADPLPKRFYHARVKLQAALTGIAHHQAGMLVPVVIYDIDEPFGRQIHCVGQNMQELRKAALEAIRDLGPHGMRALQDHSQRLERGVAEQYTNDMAELFGTVQRELGLPIHPAAQQTEGPDGWPARVTQELVPLERTNEAGVGR